MLAVKKILKEKMAFEVDGLPDIDSDVHSSKRGELLEYIYGKYPNSARLANFTYLKARSAIQAAGRALGEPRYVIDQFNKQIDPIEKLKVSLARQDVKRAVDQNNLHDVVELAQKFEGLLYSMSVHAAAVVIAPFDIRDVAPLMNNKDGSAMPVAMFDMHSAQDGAGLVKYDFLGLNTIDVVFDACEAIGIKAEEIDINDPKIFEFLSSGKDTYGIFQLEKPLTRETMKMSKPKTLADIAAITAVIRPGPLHSGFHQTYIEGGQTHQLPILNEILAETKGVLLYQEQLISISQKMAGLTEYEADDLRKGVGKKKAEIIEKYKTMFVEGSIKNGYTEHEAFEVYKWFESSADYLFNKSHSILYSVLSLQCAWLRVYHPLAFWAAHLNSKLGGDRKKLLEALRRVKKMGVRFLLPDINTSAYGFTVEGDKVRFGLAAILDVGDSAAKQILDKRPPGGWLTLASFRTAVKPKKNVLEALVNVGSFDGFVESRNQVMATLQKRQLTDHLFAEDRPENQPVETRDKRGQMEKDLLGMFITKNPLEDLPAFKSNQHMLLSDLTPDHVGKKVTVVATVSNAVKKVAKSSKKPFIECLLSDPYVDMQGMCFEKFLPEVSRYVFKTNTPMLLTGYLNVDTFGEEEIEEDQEAIDIFGNGKITILQLEPLSSEDRFQVIVQVPKATTVDKLEQLQNLLRAAYDPKGDELWIEVEGKRVKAGSRVDMTQALIGQIERNYACKVVRE